MGFFRRLFGGDDQASSGPETTRRGDSPVMPGGMQVRTYEGRADLGVVGEASYQDELWRLVGGRGPGKEPVRVEVSAILVPEPDNQYDSSAVSVWISGLRVGYLSRDDARRYQPGLLALQREHENYVALRGVIAGGGLREDGQQRFLGVFLRHDPTDFGLRGASLRPPGESTMRTGLTAALATDAGDDSYDLSWVGDLPKDSAAAAGMLRHLLQRASDPLERHFIYCQLEALLYKSRDTLVRALDQYDQVCRQHDSEMESIKESFLAKWGQVPLLELYRQMAIRQQRAKDFTQALWWAERGISVYAGDCARPDAVEDLMQRARNCRLRLEPTPIPPRVAPTARQPGKPKIETLSCTNCGQEFERVRVSGRKPFNCPDCRGQGR